MRSITRKKGRTLYNLPTYVINMNERPDRWERFKNHEVFTSFRNLQRFPAVNGKRLNYRKDRRISLKTRMNISRNYRRSHYEIATLGAIGASMSHVGVWKKFLDSGAPMCLVLEDDVILSELQIHAVNELLPKLPTNCGIWILGCYLPNLIIEPIGSSKWSRVHKYTAAHAYVLTREAAKKLLEEPYPIEMHIEYYIIAAAQLKGVEVLHYADVHFEFFRKERGPRTRDSNTSQHKKSGCPSCDHPDDYSQLYKGLTRKTKHGIKIAGVIEGEQPKHILTYENTGNKKS